MNKAFKQVCKFLYAFYFGGALTAIITIVGIFCGALIGFSDSSLPTSQIILSDAIIFTSPILGVISGSFIAAKISTNKKTISVLIACIPAIYLLNIFDFDIQQLEKSEILCLLLLLPASFLGNLLYAKRYGTNSETVPPDNS